MSRIIFDIETAGTDFEALDPATQEYLLKWADSEEDKGRVRESLSFHPVTAEIITIGMLNPDTNRGVVWFQSPNGPVPPFEENGIKYECGDERELIGKFWTTVKAYDQFVTFNGRTFDCPFIMVRSAVHGIAPTRNLMPNRYSGPHIDLLDQLTFFGATRRFNLDMWCRTFSIRSPKESGITGYQVKDLFRSGRSADIARYCAGDLEATKELLLVWEKYIRFPPQGTAGD
ncbi:MAG TPA: ribonuclease H-like domain-containing protein [Dissulfurispiraceae bacterium]|nr:ribonuclease H-like domain-containing protein [Dissulfurispiraceae bacterium]